MRFHGQRLLLQFFLPNFSDIFNNLSNGCRKTLSDINNKEQTSKVTFHTDKTIY